MSDDNTRKYTCWSDDHPKLGEAEMDARCASVAAKEWVDSRWTELDSPDEVCVRVRRDDGNLTAWDVHIEVQLHLYAMQAPTDDHGNLLTYELLRERADAALASQDAVVGV